MKCITRGRIPLGLRRLHSVLQLRHTLAAFIIHPDRPQCAACHGRFPSTTWPNCTSSPKRMGALHNSEAARCFQARLQSKMEQSDCSFLGGNGRCSTGDKERRLKLRQLFTNFSNVSVWSTALILNYTNFCGPYVCVRDQSVFISQCIVLNRADEADKRPIVASCSRPGQGDWGHEQNENI